LRAVRFLVEAVLFLGERVDVFEVEAFLELAVFFARFLGLELRFFA